MIRKSRPSSKFDDFQLTELYCHTVYEHPKAPASRSFIFLDPHSLLAGMSQRTVGPLISYLSNVSSTPLSAAILARAMGLS